MDFPSQTMHDFAMRLLAVEEAAGRSTVDPPVHAVVRVCERLRISLTRLAGPDGFAALLQRAVALARAEAPSLQHVRANPDGSIEGLENLTADTTDSEGHDTDDAAAIIVHLLGLLVTFVGEPLTLQLVRDTWPDASLDEQL